jgi:hypothetical protein
MAWSVAARRSVALPGCTTHRNCANCPRYAYRWRADVIRAAAHSHGAGTQLALFPPTTYGGAA